MNISKVENWNDIKGPFKNGSILIGNGFSINISKKFEYKFMYKKGREFLKQTSDIFKKIKTYNYETALWNILNSKNVVEAAGEKFPKKLDEYYEKIQDALIKTVHKIHIDIISENAAKEICGYLKHYKNIYTTNYDVIIYWSINKDQNAFCDLFRKIDGELVFDKSVKSKNSERNILYFLHGGLHLYKKSRWETIKTPGQPKTSVLGYFENHKNSGIAPLFVTEGNSETKLKNIKDSEYLEFCFDEFSNDDGPLVILGHSLNDSDMHILKKIPHEKNKRKIAVSVFNADTVPPETQVQIKKFGKDLDICFFRSDTHPLCSKDLKTKS